MVEHGTRERLWRGQSRGGAPVLIQLPPASDSQRGLNIPNPARSHLCLLPLLGAEHTGVARKSSGCRQKSCDDVVRSLQAGGSFWVNQPARFQGRVSHPRTYQQQQSRRGNPLLKVSYSLEPTVSRTLRFVELLE